MDTLTTKEKLTPILFICASMLLGGLAWSGQPSLMPFALFILPLWYYAPDRLTAFFTYFSYSAAASYSLPSGTITYSGSALVVAIFIWVTSCIIPSIPFFIFHFNKKLLRVVGLYIALFLIMVPPFGLTSWSHPLVSTGMWFPGGGWFALLIILVAIPTALRLPVLLVVPVFLGFFNTSHSPSIDNWIGIDTVFKGSTTAGNFKPATLNDYAFDYHRQNNEIKIINSKRKGSVSLLPESSGGTWKTGNIALWKSRLKPDRVALVHASIPKADKTKDSVVLSITNKEVKTVYRQRQPVPNAMWNPFREYSYNAHWFDNPVVKIQDQKVAFFVCYEQFLLWPVLHSFTQNPTVMCAISNVWWAESGNIPAIQNSIMYSWSRLFNTPLITAKNT